MTNDDWGLVLLALGGVLLTLGGYSFMVARFFHRKAPTNSLGALCVALGIFCILTYVLTR